MHSAARNLGRTTTSLCLIPLALGMVTARRVWPAVFASLRTWSLHQLDTTRAMFWTATISWAAIAFKHRPSARSPTDPRAVDAPEQSQPSIPAGRQPTPLPMYGAESAQFKIGLRSKVCPPSGRIYVATEVPVFATRSKFLSLGRFFPATGLLPRNPEPVAIVMKHSLTILAQTDPSVITWRGRFTRALDESSVSSVSATQSVRKIPRPLARPSRKWFRGSGVL